MYFAFLDETNVSFDTKGFFIYGGIFVPVENVGKIHLFINNIRKTNNFPVDALLKFDTNARPRGITQEQMTGIKKEIVECAYENNVLFLAFLVHHEIRKRVDKSVSYQWAINRVVGEFNYFLERKNKYGFVFLDPSPYGKDAKISKTIFKGLDIKKEDRHISLDRIVGIASCNIEASNLCSMCDIILGSFRCMANYGSSKEVALILGKQLNPLLWGKETQDGTDLNDCSLIFRPRINEIRKQEIREKYSSLRFEIYKCLGRQGAK